MVHKATPHIAHPARKNRPYEVQTPGPSSGAEWIFTP